MYCPLHLNRPVTCPKEECAWFDEKHNQCIVKLLASLYSEKIITEIKTLSNYTQMQQSIVEKNIFDILFPKTINKGDNNGD